jgi:putative MFS transporter
MSQLLDSMDHAPMSPLHRQLAWAAGLGIFLDGYDTIIVGAVLVLLARQWHLGPAEYRWVGTSALAGAFLGALIGGHVADRFGRKAIYLIDLITFFFAAILCSAAWNIESLVAFRFVLGMGIGADYPISATYMAEFMPKNKRGGVITWTFGLWTGGAIVAGLVAYSLLSVGPMAWRLMLLIGAVPALFVIWLRRNLPESPRWYLRHGQPEKAAAVLARVNPSISRDELSAIVEAEQKKVITPRTPWRVLFQKRFIRATMLVCIPWFIMDLVGYYLTIYTPLILGHLGFKTAHQQILGSAMLSLTFLLGYVPLALTVDRIGRIWPQIIGFLGSALALVMVAVTALHVPVQHILEQGHLQWVPQYSALALALIFLGMMLSQAFNAFGPGNTTYVLAAEVYPTDVRAAGHGFATAFSRLGAVASTFFLPVLGKAIGTPKLLLLLAAGSVLGGVTTWLLRVDTTNKSLVQDV